MQSTRCDSNQLTEVENTKRLAWEPASICYQVMVGLTRLNLSSQLARYLRGHPAVILPRQARTQASVTHHPRRWRLRDRLSEQDIAELVAAFKAGAAKHELAARYGIGMKSVKKILRQYGVKKRSRYEGRM